MLTNLKLFFKYKEIRSLYLLVLKHRILYYIFLPVDFVRTKIEILRFYREHKDPWERFIILKAAERDAKERDRRVDLMCAIFRARTRVTNMVINMFMTVHPGDVKNYSEEEIQKKFDGEKKALIKCLSDIKKAFGIEIPTELTELVSKAALKMYDNDDQIKAFGEEIKNRLSALIEEC